MVANSSVGGGVDNPAVDPEGEEDRRCPRILRSHPQVPLGAP